jgi:hypothetical protein
MDPRADIYQSYSPYNYALNDPKGKLDPNGMWVETAGGWSTNNPNDIAEFMQNMRQNDQDNDDLEVNEGENKKYKVVGGNRNSDKGIYVVDEKGKRTGEKIGEMLTEYSFLYKYV